ncbi:MAG: nicotinate (nicotinamide) nucleotide adenylyltransferase [Candidatus Beckwithbacteria bacterium]|nr:nicotinate (nicotinamide) nucleotide adenylyltransferase [Candidatus Beckwithbacteria bacterium]
MNITLFGGSFNPPHLGHEIVLTQTFDLIPNLNEIWLLPTYQHTFVKNNDLAPVNFRLAMAKLLATDRIKVQTCEIDKKMSGQTIDSVKFLKKTYPQHQFSFLMGSDQLKTFDLWNDWQKLLKLMTFYIYPRAGFTFQPLYPNMKTLEHPLQVITNISSTIVRKRLQAGLTINHLVPEKIAAYINKNRLYI